MVCARFLYVKTKLCSEKTKKTSSGCQRGAGAVPKSNRGNKKETKLFFKATALNPGVT
jgi:hypothetical protein